MPKWHGRRIASEKEYSATLPSGAVATGRVYTMKRKTVHTSHLPVGRKNLEMPWSEIHKVPKASITYGFAFGVVPSGAASSTSHDSLVQRAPNEKSSPSTSSG
jgi:hypothetical protein